MRAFLATAASLLALLSIVIELQDARDRARSRAFAHQFSMDVRRPRTMEDIRYAASSDDAADVVAKAAFDDAVSPVTLSGFTDEERRAWISNVARRPAELAAARELVLSAIQKRPGWSLHYLRLAQVDFAAGMLGSDAARPRWPLALRRSRALAPGSDDVVLFSAAALLTGYARLDDRDRRDVPSLTARAFRVAPESAAQVFPAAAAVLGEDASVALLPDDPKPLLAASDYFAARGDVTRAAAVLTRWESAERRARATEVDALRHLEGSERTLTQAAALWLHDHPASDFDDEPMRQLQLAAVALYPGANESWNSDPRADVVRYFMSERMRGNGRGGLSRVVESMSDVPPTVVARADLAAGDLTAADDVLRRSGTTGAFEWTPFFVELAHYALDHRDAAMADGAIASLAPTALDECDVLLARRRLAAFRNDAGSVAQLDAQLATAPRAIPSQYWSADGETSLCIAPHLLPTKALDLELTAAAPALVDIVWNDARERSVRIERGVNRISIPLGNREGRWILGVVPRVGPAPSRAAYLR